MWAADSGDTGPSNGLIIGLVLLGVIIVVAIVMAVKRRQPASVVDSAAGRLTLSNASYLGGHPASPEAASPVDLTFDSAEGWVVSKGGVPFIICSWDETSAVSVEGSAQVQRRVTMTRLVLMGNFAFGARKIERQSFLVLTAQGGEYIFDIRSYTSLELRANLQPFLTRFSRPGHEPAPVRTVDPGQERSAKERLRQLDDLRADGVLSDEEYTRKRVEIINEL